MDFIPLVSGDCFCGHLLYSPFAVHKQMLETEGFQTVVSLFIFGMVVFLYLHITSQWKTGEDLEVYEMDFVNHSQLQEIAEIKQPLLFRMDKTPEFFSQLQKPFLAKYGHADVNIKDVHDYYSGTPHSGSVVLPFHSAADLAETDTSKRYLCEGNGEFVEDTGLEKVFAKMDAHLKPHFNMATKYDVMFGSKHATTPFKYHNHSRLYLAVCSGKIRVKLAPWKSRKYLYPTKDYETYEFYSPINIWNPQPQYLGDAEKVMCLEIDVYPQYILSIPPYWWYSIQYSTDTSTVVGSFTYNTVINGLAHCYDWGMYYLTLNGISLGAKNAPSAIAGIDGGVGVSNGGGTGEKGGAEGADVSTILGQNPDVPLPPPTKEPIVTNSGVYNP